MLMRPTTHLASRENSSHVMLSMQTIQKKGVIQANYHLCGVALRAASYDDRRSREEGIPTIWLVESKSLFFRPSHGRMSPKGEHPPKCLYDNTFWEFWFQEFLLSTKSLGKTRMETRTMVERRNYGAQSFSSRLWPLAWLATVWSGPKSLCDHLKPKLWPLSCESACNTNLWPHVYKALSQIRNTRNFKINHLEKKYIKQQGYHNSSHGPIFTWTCTPVVKIFQSGWNFLSKNKHWRKTKNTGIQQTIPRIKQPSWITHSLITQLEPRPTIKEFLSAISLQTKANLQPTVH